MPHETRQPLGYYEDGGVPVFRPTMDEFADFGDFISKIEPYGMEKGIVKVIPPEQWVASLPTLHTNIRNIRIKNPIMQNINGQGGLYRLQNIEKGRTYNLPEWRALCERPENQPPAKRGESRHKNEKPRQQKGTDPFEEFDYAYDAAEFTDERCAELEKVYWKSLAYNNPMYGADMPGSLFDESTTEWNVANLDNILNSLRVSIPGVNTAYLYCGMWKATFAWHLEDMDLFSINYIHFGAPKQWYSISQKDHKKFYNLMREMWPEEYKNCREFLRHKTFHAMPSVLKQRNIEVNHVIHRQNEFMITFPYGYHSGFNFGYNVAESVNFATESWIPYGRESAKCQCISDSVGIDMDQLVRHMNGQYSEDESSSSSEEEGVVESRRLTHGLPTPPADRKRKLNFEPVTPQLKKKSKRKVYTECALCPNLYSDDLIPLTTDPCKRAHRTCILAVPETRIITNPITGEESFEGLNSIPKERCALKCLECHSSRGACFQCAQPKCTRSYHGSCAGSAGVFHGSAQENIYLCKFHRPKRLPISHLETDPLTLNYAYSLLPGDVVQCQVGDNSHDIFAGIVDENCLSEQIVILRALPHSTEKIEVTWKWILHPYLKSGLANSLDVAEPQKKEPSTIPKRITKPKVPSRLRHRGKQVIVDGEKVTFALDGAEAVRKTLSEYMQRYWAVETLVAQEAVSDLLLIKESLPAVHQFLTYQGNLSSLVEDKYIEG